MHSWTCDRATICNILVYHACNEIETMAIHCNQQTVWYLDPLLKSLHIWLYHIFQNVLEPFLTKIYIILICLDACKLYSSTKWPLKQCHWIYNTFASFVLSLIPHGLAENFYPGFTWISAEPTEIPGILWKCPKTEYFWSAPSVLTTAVNSIWKR
jgi:hypothetical protein